MNDRIQKVKTRLLALGYIDNDWLAKYLEMLEVNLYTPKNRKSTQEHHAIPVNSYWTSDEPYNRKEATKLSRLDKDNFKVNLLYKDHLVIHSYLTLCTDLNKIQLRYESQATLRKQNSILGYRAAKEKGTLISINEALMNKRNLKMPNKPTHKAKTINNVLRYYSAEETEEILNL